MSIDRICNIVENMDNKDAEFDELNQLDETEETFRQKVIEAHQTLMALSDENKIEFQDLISVLKSDS